MYVYSRSFLFIQVFTRHSSCNTEEVQNNCRDEFLLESEIPVFLINVCVCALVSVSSIVSQCNATHCACAHNMCNKLPANHVSNARVCVCVMSSRKCLSYVMVSITFKTRTPSCEHMNIYDVLRIFY